MTKRTSHYPLGQLILQTIKDSQLSPGHFVTAIGYGNPAKGIKALDRLVKYGANDPVFLARLTASCFAPKPEALQEAIKETDAIIEEEERLFEIKTKEEERAAFRPFIQGVPELEVPTQIFLHAVTGGHARFTIELPPSFPSWPLEEQYRYTEEKITHHFASCEGRTLFMGRLTAYRLFRSYGEAPLLLSVEGKPLGRNSGAPVSEATVEIGGKTLSEREASRLLVTRPTSSS